jgi:hypothetical protein
MRLPPTAGWVGTVAPMKLRSGARGELIENLSSAIWDLDCQDETIHLNYDGKREEGAAGSFTLSEADERPEVGIRHEA